MKEDNFWSDKFIVWDEFVRNDFIRNSIIIPNLIENLNSIPKQDLKIADVGCGTGYIPYTVINSANNIQSCLCIDIDSQVIDFAEHKYRNSKLEYKIHNLFEELPVKDLDLVYSIFTLMEFKLTNDLCQNIYNSLAEKGRFIIYIPDMLIDILKKRNDYEVEQYIEGCLPSYKIDKKTKIKYPFYMNRIEFIINDFLAVGLILHSIKMLDFTDSGENNRIFSLQFVKNGLST